MPLAAALLSLSLLPGTATAQDAATPGTELPPTSDVSSASPTPVPSEATETWTLTDFPESEEVSLGNAEFNEAEDTFLLRSIAPGFQSSGDQFTLLSREISAGADFTFTVQLTSSEGLGWRGLLLTNSESSTPQAGLFVGFNPANLLGSQKLGEGFQPHGERPVPLFFRVISTAGVITVFVSATAIEWEQITEFPPAEGPATSWKLALLSSSTPAGSETTTRFTTPTLEISPAQSTETPGISTTDSATANANEAGNGSTTTDPTGTTNTAPGATTTPSDANPAATDPEEPTTWYVNSQKGKDYYDGTYGQPIPAYDLGPKKTIDAAEEEAAPGDTIIVRQSPVPYEDANLSGPPGGELIIQPAAGKEIIINSR